MRPLVKNRKRLIRLGEYLGVICLLVSGLMSDVYYPHSTSKEIGYVDTITIDRKSHIDKYKTTYYYVYIFYINNKEYATFADNVNYNYLTGKLIQLKYYTDPLFPDGYEIYEIAYNNKVVFSMDEYKPTFIKWLVLCIISLTFCIWLLLLKFRNTETTPKIDTTKIEEYFFDNWSIMKKNDKYILSYISKLDRDIKRIKITEEEFTLTKLSKMTLNDFISKYNLW